MIAQLLSWTRRLLPAARPEPVLIGDEAWSRLLARSPLFECLDAAGRCRLRAHCAHFLARKTFSPAGGHVLDDAQCLAIAALACLPVLDLGIDWLDGWSEVIVYPGGFRVRREHHDEHSGVVTEGDEELIGEAWERGPVILSWSDVMADLDDPFTGLNVVIHEIAHKLDMLDGAMNGVPRLPDGLPRAEWISTMQAAYDAFVALIDRGADTAIDPYAAESAEEFFAVVSEAHFSSPACLHDELPAVADLLQRFYSRQAHIG
jgi:Mlc titration factor MtfA (ptsG expression regulator)